EEMAQRLIDYVDEPSFAEQVDWQSQNYQGLRGTGLDKRPKALRARAALETLAGEIARKEGDSRRSSSYGGASASNHTSSEDMKEGWQAAWAIATGDRTKEGGKNYRPRGARMNGAIEGLKATPPPPPHRPEEDTSAQPPDPQ